MPRLHTLYLPNGRRSTPFAFILDQTNPMTETAIEAWKSFAEKCGALDIMLTADTIDIDPETSDGWQPDDDEPVDYSPAGPCCGPRVITPLDLVSMVQAAHAAAWVPWEPANLDPESPKAMTHREDACPAFNDGVTGCPMHDPILEGGWVTWPYFATPQGVIARICDHGISHPTPEEYLGGFDTPHLCDGCPCAPVADFSIVVSDLANTRLPRGTLLLGTKDDPRQAASRIAPEWADHLAKQPRDTSGRWVPDDPTPVTAPPANAYARSGLVAPAGSYPFLAAPEVPGADAEPGSVRRGGTARVQPLGADGEPVGEAKDYPLAGPVEITEKQYGTPTEEPPVWNGGFAPTTDAAYVGCGAGSDRGDCTLRDGHEGLHEFGPFNRV